MTGYQSKKAAAQAIDKVNWADHEPDGLEQPEQEQKCWCTTCRPITMSDMRFVVCPDCGNKRCPKANDHRNDCTGSNEVGQNGSSWEHVKPLAQPEQEPAPCCGKYETCTRACTPRGLFLGKREALAEQEPVACKFCYGSGAGNFGVHSKCICQYAKATPPQRKPLTINEVEQILAQHNYEIHGDRARYIVRMTEAAHDIKENT